MIKLKVWRTRKKMSIQELADKSGVDRATISRIEHGRSKPYGQTLGKLAEALEVDATELMEEDKTTEPDHRLVLAGA